MRSKISGRFLQRQLLKQVITATWEDVFDQHVQTIRWVPEVKDFSVFDSFLCNVFTC